MYEYPFGNGQQLNLDWFLSEWKNLLAAWEAEKNGIEGALQAEIDRAEAALADVFAARDAAAQSATAAGNSADAAAQSATDASGYLTTVRADANAAQDAARNAAESAQTALASKNTAANSERNAAQSEANALASKNAAAQSATDALAHKDAAAQSAADALANKNAAAQSAENAEDAAASVEALTIINTVNGAVASFNDSADNVPLKKLVVDIEPVQSGSGNPSPDNIRPISGWTQCNIYQSGEDTSNPTIIPISFPSEVGTVYGGTLDVLTGQLSVNRKTITINGSENILPSNANRFFINISEAKIIDPNNQRSDASVICEKASPTTWANLADKSIGFWCSPLYGNGISFKWDNITTVEGWKTYFANNPTQFSYELKTPLTYQLTSIEVETLLGYNNIWSDAGNVEVSYIADNKTYIDKQNAILKNIIAPVLDKMIADTALAVNDFRIVGNTLYKVTAPIASGGTLTVGTNVIEATVGAQITALLNT